MTFDEDSRGVRKCTHKHIQIQWQQDERCERFERNGKSETKEQAK